mmetsp:Transcript_117635/g.293264  ORF Transcript_117635/g.293264 Transcript_117635/m.293264 type:complete len:254 (+) Transcript_117635:328-1089(+)
MDWRGFSSASACLAHAREQGVLENLEEHKVEVNVHIGEVRIQRWLLEPFHEKLSGGAPVHHELGRRPVEAPLDHELRMSVSLDEDQRWSRVQADGADVSHLRPGGALLAEAVGDPLHELVHGKADLGAAVLRVQLQAMRDQQSQGCANREEVVQRPLNLLHGGHELADVGEARGIQVRDRLETLADLVLEIPEATGDLPEHPAVPCKDLQDALLEAVGILGRIIVQVAEVLDVVLDHLADRPPGAEAERQILK